MQFRRRTPAASYTDFYFTESNAGGMSDEQQYYLADLIMSYRKIYPSLAVNAVWDFGMEEGDPLRGEKYGDFETCRDNAVYNAQMLTISFNHVRVRKMPCEVSEEDVKRAEAYYESFRDLPERAMHMESQMLASGIPWPQIEMRIRENLGITLCAENLLPVTDRYFADVQAIRMLENSESIHRIAVHEIGHMLSEESGAVNDKKIRKLFGKCRDGFENLYEFCAECFMASELTDRIGLANEYRDLLHRVIQ
jgi:hypothetical protein